MAASAELLNNGRAEFAKGAKGDADAAGAALEIFKSLQAQEPRNPLYLAYLGACSGLKARDSWMPWNKMKHADAGVDYLDSAIKELDSQRAARSPGIEQIAHETTLVVGSAYLAFPKNLNRYTRGRTLILDVVDGAQFNRLPAVLQIQYLGRAIDLAVNESDQELEKRYRMRMASLGAQQR